METNFSCYAQTDILDTTSSELHSSVVYTLRLGALWQLQLLSCLVGEHYFIPERAMATLLLRKQKSCSLLWSDPFSGQQKCC